VLSWEKSLLEPKSYWSKVPLKWQPYFSFYNTAVGDSSLDTNPLTFIRQLSSARDFVSLKLDIDAPTIELSLASTLLSDSKVAALVDEFFFEIHYRCELMMLCGWGNISDTPKREIRLDRLPVMEFFQKLRYAGVRSHFWP
jgi:hypothetical protein